MAADSRPSTDVYMSHGRNVTPAAGDTSYGVHCSATSGGPYATIASGVTGTSTVDAGVVNGVTSYRVVMAANAAGESAPSNQASAKAK